MSHVVNCVFSSIQRRVNSEVAYAGPLPTPPPSASTSSGTSNPYPKRVRRVEGCSESEAAYTIGDAEVHNEDFRCGGPHLVRLPAFNDHLTPNDPLNVAWDEHLEGPVREILNCYRIDLTGGIAVGPLRRSSTGKREKYDTALIIAQKHSLTSDVWFRACKEILQLFRSKGFMKLNVEIIDDRANPTLTTYPASLTDPFVESWTILRPTILEILGENDWTLLYVVRRRSKNHHEGPITIAITVTEESTKEWSAIRDEIVRLLDSRGHHDVAIAICRANVWHGSSFDDQVLGHRDWDVRAKLGGSLGLRGSADSASTFGGFVELQNTLLDHESAIAGYQKGLDDKRHSISNLRQRILADDPSVSKGDKILYERQQAAINEIEDTIWAATSFGQQKRHLGSVFAASGFKTSPQKNILDWALIDVEDSRITSNEIPPDGGVSPDFFTTYCPPQPIMSGTTSVAEGNHVFKIGRRTGFTAGIVNGIKLCDLQGWVTNSQGQKECVRGTALLILPHACETFGDPGDSGSFVMDGQGRFVGLYFGGDRERNAGLVTEAPNLFEDIKKVTGCRDVRI
ncbi:uncharacterized protein GIQ15_06081 [Arthroderma uncinatum]|uniref:uncharacterized protein n=1 Tax=Arthroderma uncinatum TaxID=74035 RepID=UPI00144A841F|nr:uncharacterized protein GIQ15_06081 [Arthroderma uncinatum]KAF3480734.1 hypothetical protein GIQ15_06081 [Arthroderma uncinatum]